MMQFIRFMDEDFVKEILHDGKELEEGRKFDITAVDFEPDSQFDEYEFYIHRVGFFLVNFIHLCDQLDFSVEFLYRYDYNKSKTMERPNRVDYIILNIENYYIRFQSVQDRLLQLINSVFHLCVDENEVNNTVIMSNLKVMRTDVPTKFKRVKRLLRNVSENRNQIIHKHSYREVELNKIELFYLAELDDDDWGKEANNHRKLKLKDYLKKKREEFTKYNDSLFELILDIFDLLHKEYKSQKHKLGVFR